MTVWWGGNNLTWVRWDKKKRCLKQIRHDSLIWVRHDNKEEWVISLSSLRGLEKPKQSSIIFESSYKCFYKEELSDWIASLRSQWRTRGDCRIASFAMTRTEDRPDCLARNEGSGDRPDRLARNEGSGDRPDRLARNNGTIQYNNILPQKSSVLKRSFVKIS